MRTVLFAIGLATASVVSAQDVSITVLPVTASDIRDPSALNARIKSAIDKSCGIYSAEPYDQWTAISRCRKEARRGADRQLEQLINLQGEGVELAFRR